MNARVLVAGLTLLVGCDMLISGKGAPGEQVPVAAPAPAPPPPADVAATAAEPAAPAKPKDPLDLAIEAQDAYVYNPIGKKDPFRSFLALASADDEVPRTPLQRYDLDQYQLVGIVWGVDRPRALVEDPEATGHVVEIGTYMGKNWGKVTQITSSGLVITEEYQTIDGELVVNEIPLSLPDPTAAGGRR